MHKCKCHPQEFFRKTQEAEHQHTGKESLLCAAVSSVFVCCNFFKGHKIRKVHWNCLSLFPKKTHGGKGFQQVNYNRVRVVKGRIVCVRAIQHQKTDSDSFSTPRTPLG